MRTLLSRMLPKVKKNDQKEYFGPRMPVYFPAHPLYNGEGNARKMNQKVALRASVAESLECEEEECPLHPEKRIPFWRTPAI